MIEFTLTTPGALELIEEFSRLDGADGKRLLVGAGTVLSRKDARQAVTAGARFLASPVTDDEVIDEATELDVPAIPGTATPTEMFIAVELGADIVKVFPAPHDIPTFVRQIRGPLPELRIFPTAGVDEDNFLGILDAGAFGVGFVSSLFRPGELAAGDWGSIEARAERIHGRFREWNPEG
jgi:2-dehydro-3-deoxyphosphogluconate aldolase/(4S)-4-hydroxy-2-oxoglutarate aldolase